ncbi:hypothetical protein ACFE04_001791 [Oxalis oulophora]
MDSYEATKIVFSRIQSLDPENASKIMGLLLIQDHGEKEMIRLAFGTEALVQSVIAKSRKELGVSMSRQNSNASRLGISIPPSLSIPNNPWSNISNSNSTDSDELNLGLNSSAAPFYGSGKSDMIDEFHLQEQLSFLNENSGSTNNPYPADLALSPGSEPFPSYWGNSGSAAHRRSFSVSDVMGGDDSGFGWRPCLYYARGFCKNGSNCKFVHSGLGPLGDQPAAAMDGALVGSPNNIDMMDHCRELIRSKSLSQQQRFAAAAQMNSSLPYSPKSMSFLLQQQQNDRMAAALMMNDDNQKFGRSRLERLGLDLVNPASRQIYLTFPADSTFREEDVSNYFGIFGPVQDVRIPYQQKRMFGFVTFVYPETVKLILAKGNPHFVCDARVLVKPYKEKGKVPDKSKQQPMERGEFSPCGTPTGLDSRDPFDLQLGARMFCNAQDMLWRRKLEEQADLQQALELQSRRLMNLQLLDAKKHHHRAISNGSPIPSPTTHSPNIFGQSFFLPQENCSSPAYSVSAQEKQSFGNGKELSGSEDNGSGKESSESDLPESLEHNLPDSPFASPSKGSKAHFSAFSNVSVEANEKNSALDMAASFNSFNCQLPRFSSGHGGANMYAGRNGPTCPVGI